ncbi:L,D-transpeptidase [Nocardiopsis rhodophaea]|uniref:L,D-transpeptidase n=3 Tax=Nocardiopsis rhodophaea TaxID=280238 RepID=UPI0031DD5B03
MCTAAVMFAATACSGGASELASQDATDSGPLEVSISPEDGATEVRPDLPVTVTASGGEITDVKIEESTPVPEDGAEDSGDDIPASGTLNGDKTEWVSDWTLAPGSDVTVTAVVDKGGESSEFTSEFSTQEAVVGKRLELKQNQPNSGDTVGIGMPVMIDFDMPVQNKARVEAAMEVTSDKPATGAWNWFGDKKAVFRPGEYWQPHQKVTVDLHLAGVQAAPGVYGVQDHRIEFEVGREQITEVEEDAHSMTVERDGEKVKDFPVSLGMVTTRKYTTTAGAHLVMSRERNVELTNGTLGVSKDDPRYYSEIADYAMRISWSGEYLHSAPWNPRVGEANTSHGCINMTVADSKWYYDNSLVGDPVVITGTDRELEVDNGWGYWQRPWKEWLDNSALGEADDTGKAGTPGSPHHQE